MDWWIVDPNDLARREEGRLTTELTICLSSQRSVWAEAFPSLMHDLQREERRILAELYEANRKVRERHA